MNLSALNRQREAPPPQPMSPAIPQTLPLEQTIRKGDLLVSPALAQRILDEANYDGQRPVTPHHVALLADDMRRGLWTAGSQICFGALKGRLRLVNGQHRLHALMSAGVSIEFQAQVVPVETEAQLGALYYRFDRKQRQRSTAEVLTAVGVAGKYGLSKTMTTAIFNAALVIEFGFKRPNYQQDPVKVRSDDARLESAKSWWKIGAVYEGLIASAPIKVRHKLLSPQVVAVALATLKWQPELAASFWKGLADNDGLKRGDPRNSLLTDFASRSLTNSNMAGALATSTAWNAFFEDRDLKLVKVYEGSLVRVLGTPFDGRRG